MKKTSIVAIALALTSATWIAVPAFSSQQVVPLATHERVELPIAVVEERAEAPSAQPCEDDAECRALAAYVESAMRAWNAGPMAGAVTRYHEIAQDIAFVALRSPRVWKDSDGTREALLLAGIAWFETRFRDYVDDGSCNRWMLDAWKHGGNLNALPRKQRETLTLGTCDGGRAASIWQIHFGESDATRGLTSIDGYSNRKLAASSALAIARRSIQAGAGLMQYVGGVGPDRVEKARQRLAKGESWYAKHPR